MLDKHSSGTGAFVQLAQCVTDACPQCSNDKRAADQSDGGVH